VAGKCDGLEGGKQYSSLTIVALQGTFNGWVVDEHDECPSVWLLPSNLGFWGLTDCSTILKSHWEPNFCSHLWTPKIGFLNMTFFLHVFFGFSKVSH